MIIYTFSVNPTGLLWCFSVVEYQKISQTQCLWQVNPPVFFGLEKKPTFKPPKLTSAGFWGLYFTKKAAFTTYNFAQVSQLVWTNKDR